MHIAIWYGGQADVPIDLRFVSKNSINDLGFNKALVCWYKNVLLADPPPLAKYKNLY